MKKLIFPIVCCFISVTVSAQLIKPKAETQKKQSELDWFNCSFDQDSVYGAEVNKAYDWKYKFLHCQKSYNLYSLFIVLFLKWPRVLVHPGRCVQQVCLLCQ